MRLSVVTQLMFEIPACTSYVMHGQRWSESKNTVQVFESLSVSFHEIGEMDHALP
ncbi:MAG: hypothetical protein JWM11_2371 [Planctomycetaceae bacterium]|nr:hypothetical protein [Planctomycetaceae bacterium]